MSTVQNILDRAGRLLSVVNSGESLTTTESSDALIALNAMLDSWRNDRLMCYAIRDESITMANGTQTYTVGPGGTLNTTRPVRIEMAYLVDSNNISYGIDVLDEEQWASIVNKNQTSTYPARIWYQPSMATGTIYVHPIPTTTSTLHILDYTPVLAFSTVGDSISLPPGWEEALAYNLAIVLAPEYEVQPSQLVLAGATNSKAAIKRVNGRPIKAITELGRLNIEHNTFNIYSGQ